MSSVYRKQTQGTAGQRRMESWGAGEQGRLKEDVNKRTEREKDHKQSLGVGGHQLFNGVCK